MNNNIEGKIVVITDASSGFGEATARHLSEEGATIVLGGRRIDCLKALAAELTWNGAKAIAVRSDVTKMNQVKKLIDAAIQTFGRIDVMVNSAGIMRYAPLECLKIDDWTRTVDVNIKGVLHGIAAALPYMKEQKSGHIINFSLAAGHKAGSGFVVYAATKHTVRVLSEVLRQEVKPYNIRTTLIAPCEIAEPQDSAANSNSAECKRKFDAEFRICGDSFAQAVVFAMSQPEDLEVNEIVLRPNRQDV